MKKAIDIYKAEFEQERHEFGSTDYAMDALYALQAEQKELKELLYRKWRTAEDHIDALKKAAIEDKDGKKLNAEYVLGINKLMNGVVEYINQMRKVEKIIKNIDFQP